MRDAFGGAFMLKLFLFFFIIYICIMAAAISYTKAFRVKNGVINIIEQNSFGGKTDNDTLGKIETYLSGVSYSYDEDDSISNYCTSKEDSEEEDDNYIFVNGSCIVPHTGNDSDKYYEVVTFIHIELPFFGINITIPVHGETKIIY